MKNSITKILILLTSVFLLGCNSISLKNVKDLIQATKPYYLMQNYDIFCSKEKTQIQGSVYYMQFSQENEKQFKYPQKVEFNGVKMENSKLKRDYDEAPCKNLANEKVASNEFVVAPESEKTPTTLEQSDFAFVQNKFQTTNRISVIDENGNGQMFDFTFEPKEFATNDPLKLSRSKENIIQMKGQGGKDSSFLLTSGQGDGIDEKTIKFDAAKNILTVSGKDLSKIKNKFATFMIQSSDSQAIPTLGVATGNYYSIYFTDERCVEIIE